MRIPALLSSMVLFATLLPGQITIGPEDMPTVSDALPYSTAMPIEADLMATGEAFLWDFSELLPLMDEEEIMVSVGSTPFLYQFYFNNPLLYPDHVASYAREGMDLDLQLITVEDVYEYFRNNSTGFRNVGFGAMVNGLPTSVRRQPVDVIYEFPLVYNDQSSSFSAWELTVPNTFFLRSEQLRNNTVDGWGTLYLPTDTFDVLRVRSVLARHDSIYVTQFGTGMAFDAPETVEYKWLAQGMGRPVLAITTIAGTPATIEYFRSGDINTSIDHVQRSEGITLYPNPVAHDLHFRSATPSHGRAQIRDAQGRVVLTSEPLNGATSWRISVRSLPAGIYTVEMEGNTPWQGRFIVAH